MKIVMNENDSIWHWQMGWGETEHKSLFLVNMDFLENTYATSPGKVFEATLSDSN